METPVFQPGLPSTSCRFCNVFKLKIAFIEIELIGQLVGSKKNILQTIIIYIANSNAGAIVHIFISEYILLFRFCNLITKMIPLLAETSVNCCKEDDVQPVKQE